MEAPSRVLAEIAAQFPVHQLPLSPIHEQEDSDWIGFDLFKKLERATQENTVFNQLPNGSTSFSCLGPWEVVKWYHISGTGGIQVNLLRGSQKDTIASVGINKVNMIITKRNYGESIIALNHPSLVTEIEKLITFIQEYRVFPS